MTKIKICGVTDLSAIACINRLTPDYVGFILSSGFRRSIPRELAREMRGALDRSVAAVGVFVNERAETVADFCERGIVDVVQLHGDEDERYIERLKRLCAAPVVKAVGVSGGKIAPYPENCDFLLLDASDPVRRGGTGRKIEWRRYDGVGKPFFLAGGITADNVKEALRAVAPYGVDCSGGVETDGRKDQAKMQQYVKNIREYDNHADREREIR